MAQTGQEAVIPDARASELPADEAQELDSLSKEMDVLNLSQHPGWEMVRDKLEEQINKYRHPVFDPSTPYEEIGKEYLMAQTVAVILEGVLDDVRGIVERHTRT